MRPATRRYEFSPVRLYLLTATEAIVVIGTLLATFGPRVAEAWPAPRYECYCKNCYDGYFICRNHNYTCNCAGCSCYNDVHSGEMLAPRKKNGNNNSKSAQSNLGRGPRRGVGAHVRRKVPIGYNGALQIRPQKYPFP